MPPNCKACLCRNESVLCTFRNEDVLGVSNVDYLYCTKNSWKFTDSYGEKWAWLDKIVLISIGRFRAYAGRNLAMSLPLQVLNQLNFMSMDIKFRLAIKHLCNLTLLLCPLWSLSTCSPRFECRLSLPEAANELADLKFGDTFFVVTIKEWKAVWRCFGAGFVKSEKKI